MDKQFDGLNAIQYAAREGDDRFITGLTTLPEEAFNQATRDGMTPLHLAAVKGHLNAVRALLDKGANPEISSLQNQLPIHSALHVPISKRKDRAFKQQKELIFKELYNRFPASLTSQDTSGNTPLHLICISGFPDLITWLTEQNAPLDFIKNSRGQYPVHTGILNNQIDVVRLLLGIDGVASQEDNLNQKPLHYAAQYGSKEMVELCYHTETDINCQDSSGNTPLELARQRRSPPGDVLAFLIAHGAKEHSVTPTFEGPWAQVS